MWQELAGEADGPVLELGCGTGRVGLHLARRGHSVAGIDSDTTFVATFNQQAEKLPAAAELTDARSFDLNLAFDLVLAPMQLIQLLADKKERVACLSCTARHLGPRGLAAVAIVEESADGLGGSTDRSGSIGDRRFRSPLPDVREVDGWVYSSLPLSAELTDGEIVVRRLRQTVSPQGELSDEVDEVRLRALSAAELEREAEAAGLRPAGRRAVPATDAHVSSTVVLLERGA